MTDKGEPDAIVLLPIGIHQETVGDDIAAIITLLQAQGYDTLIPGTPEYEEVVLEVGLGILDRMDPTEGGSSVQDLRAKLTEDEAQAADAMHEHLTQEEAQPHD